MRFAAVVLAAGKSDRMGGNKLLLEVGGRPIIDWVLDALNVSGLRTLVVLGHRQEDLRPIVCSSGAEVVFNPAYREGMTGSFKAGLIQVTADAAFLVLGDQFGLDVRLLNRMATAMECDSEALIVSPIYRGRLGHPVLFRRVLFPEIQRLGPRETVRDVVQRYDGLHRTVEGDFWCVFDIDTPEDYSLARRLFESNRDAAHL